MNRKHIINVYLNINLEKKLVNKFYHCYLIIMKKFNIFKIIKLIKIYPIIFIIDGLL